MSANIENTSPVVGDENDDPQTEVTTVKAECKKAEQHDAKNEKIKVLQQVTRHNINRKLETPEKAKVNPMLENSQENAIDGTLDSTGRNNTADADLEGQAEFHLQELSKSLLKILRNTATELEKAIGLIDANCNEPSKKMEENATGGTLDSTGRKHTSAADLDGQAESHVRELSKSLLKMLRDSAKESEEAFGLVDANCDEPNKKMVENATGGTLDSTGENNITDDILKHVQEQIKSIAINIKDLQDTQELVAGTCDGLSKKKMRSDVLEDSEAHKALNNMEKLPAKQAQLLTTHAFNVKSLTEELTRVAKRSVEVKQLAEKMKVEYGIDEVTDDNNEEEDFPRTESKPQ